MFRRTFLGVAAVLAFSALTPLAASADRTFNVVPLDGAHWQAGVGLVDASGNGQVGLLQTVTTAGHTDVAQLNGFDRQPTSALHSVGFAVGLLPNGINPCWLIEFTGPDGTQGMVHVIASADRSDMTRTDLGGGFTQWTWTPRTLPAGTIDRVVIGLMAATTPSPDTGPVAFDDFSANGLTATNGGQASG
jgi:hypothetical protein